MIDEILADEQFDPTQAGEMPSAAGQVYWPVQDHQNTVRQIVNSSGAVVWSATYDAFGNATISNPQNIFLRKMISEVEPRMNADELRWEQYTQ